MNLNTSPYFDDYSAEKNYSQILVVPGRTAQAREVTQIQTMFLDFMRRFGDSVLKDGGIVAGCEVIIDGTNISIAEGKVYHQGLVRRVPHSMVTITGVGREYVGVKVVETIVTENEDPTLLDPAQGYENYNQPGAHRLKQEIVVVANDPDSAILYKFDDGQIVMEVVAPQVDSIIDMLARRTYDESGNYKVAGLELVSKDKYTENTVSINVENGKAYIRGYEISKPTPVEVVLDKAQNHRMVQYEPKVFLAATPSYKLNNAPLKAMSKLVATVETSQSITRGSVVGGLDPLPFTPVVDIVSISDGGHSYVKNIDYILNDDKVDWSPGGVEPSIGSSYTVVWKHNKELTMGVDYSVTKQGEDWYIAFLVDGDKPVEGSTFTVDYEFYLSRKDLICMNRLGEIVVIKGQPDVARLAAVPMVDSVDLLRLGSVFLPPNSNSVTCITQSITNMSMEKIHKMLTRIEELEYNDAIADLDNEAMDGEPATELKGILTDGFIGFTKADLSHNLFTASMDIDRGELTLPSGETLLTPSIDSGVSTVSLSNRLITAPYTEQVALEQKHSTEVMLVNPYAVFNRNGVLRLSPMVDNWIEGNTVIVQGGTVTNTINIRRWWFHQGSSWANEEKRMMEELGFVGGGSALGWNGGSATKTRVAGERVLDEAITYMRRINVQVQADNFVSFADNISCKFDGIVVPLSPQSPEYQGTTAGTLKADGLGRVRGQFTIPENVRTGTRKVELYNQQNKAEDMYVAEGRRRTTQRTVIHEVSRVAPIDPLAQSFGFETDTMLTSVGLFFRAKDALIPVVIQIRNMINGYPGTTVFAEKTLLPTDVSVSELGTVETKVTFDDPVLCTAMEQYCVAILTDSNVYSMFIGGLGDKDVRTSAVVLSNPFPPGVMFSSSNALTWTAHQTKDLKFKVYSAVFSGNGTLVFQPFTAVSFDRVMLMADFLTPQNTRCTWEFKINTGGWMPLSAYDDIELSQLATSVQLRATLTKEGSISAILAKDSLRLVGFANELISDYISRNMALSQPSTIIKQVVELSIPSGSEAQVMFATDTSGTNWTIQSDPVTEVLGDGYVRYTFTKTLGSPVSNFRARLKLQTSSPVIVPRARKLLNIVK